MKQNSFYTPELVLKANFPMLNCSHYQPVNNLQLKCVLF
ncbi:hypothetical protein EG68_05350 [Paragonimus skrjabini miyazakii]|uniref:Uncharacterized protein n=1 Tax=Paragonimus skrjabini miyazakii TaxID=59628 RepID=A0A8S9YYH4_9TREM|nr:hypothetical protein EG68_05350 [Paragonimus skrjabini miyazakii]